MALRAAVPYRVGQWVLVARPPNQRHSGQELRSLTRPPPTTTAPGGTSSEGDINYLGQRYAKFSHNTKKGQGGGRGMGRFVVLHSGTLFSPVMHERDSQNLEIYPQTAYSP